MKCKYNITHTKQAATERESDTYVFYKNQRAQRRKVFLDLTIQWIPSAKGFILGKDTKQQTLYFSKTFSD